MSSSPGDQLGLPRRSIKHTHTHKKIGTTANVAAARPRQLLLLLNKTFLFSFQKAMKELWNRFWRPPLLSLNLEPDTPVEKCIALSVSQPPFFSLSLSTKKKRIKFLFSFFLKFLVQTPGETPVFQ